MFEVTVKESTTTVYFIEAEDEDAARNVVESTPEDELQVKHVYEVRECDWAVESVTNTDEE